MIEEVKTMDGRSDIGAILERADALHGRLGARVHDQVTTAIYAAAGSVAGRSVESDPARRWTWELTLDKLITSRLVGLPLMLAMLAGVFWLTIAGSNIPSAFLAGILIEEGGLTGWMAEFLGMTAPAWLSVSLLELLHRLFELMHSPWWLTGFVVDGVYLGLAWVLSVMLPPMAIFFPLFTLLEDLGFLPRVAFNMDRFFRAAGAHGKQALTMSMGFGCNAAGVVACRIIDSPRERLIAIVTNNFVPCNGRWPTLIMIASLFVAASFPPALASVVSVGTVTGITVLGIGVTLAVSFVLSRTLLKGVASSFTLELPPYRPPQIGRVLYTSLIDRTFFVLRRALVCAAPAGGLIWLLGAIHVGDATLFQYLAGVLNPAGQALGLDGVILIAFIFAIPANEIVIPTIIMGYAHVSRMTDMGDPAGLFAANGWTMMTAVCLMLFSLLHYPCTTTTMTIWAETRSVKWTVLSNLIPLTIAVVTCATVAAIWRLAS